MCAGPGPPPEGGGARSGLGIAHASCIVPAGGQGRSGGGAVPDPDRRRADVPFLGELRASDVFDIAIVSALLWLLIAWPVSYTHLTLPTNREV